jgi:hypothetical protein
MSNPHKSLTELAMQKKREAYQWKLSADAKQSGPGGLDMRMAEHMEDEADQILAVYCNEPPVTQMGEVSHPHIAGLKQAGKGKAIDTLQHSGIIPEEASIKRTDLLIQDSIDITALALDAANTVQAENSLEKMLVHQMALAHEMAMKMGDATMRELQRLKQTQNHGRHRSDEGVECQRLANSTAKLMSTYQQGMLTLQKLRTGGNQTMTVQHVNIEAGGQAVIGSVQGATPQGESKKK